MQGPLIALSAAHLVLGRAAQGQCQFDSPAVSGRHCSITCKRGEGGKLEVQVKDSRCHCCAPAKFQQNQQAFVVIILSVLL